VNFTVAGDGTPSSGFELESGIVTSAIGFASSLIVNDQPRRRRDGDPRRRSGLRIVRAVAGAIGRAIASAITGTIDRSVVSAVAHDTVRCAIAGAAITSAVERADTRVFDRVVVQRTADATSDEDSENRQQRAHGVRPHRASHRSSSEKQRRGTYHRDRPRTTTWATISRRDTRPLRAARVETVVAGCGDAA
jgi:hypothetical protein